MKSLLSRSAVTVSAILILGAVAMSQPAVTLKSLDAGGVYLLPSTEAEAGRFLDLRRDKALDVLLPYAPLIKNGSSREVIAYDVVWASTGADGKTVTHEEVLYDFTSFPSPGALPVGGSRVVSHIRGLGSSVPQYVREMQRVNNLLTFFGEQKAIQISLEAVVFDDGTAIGPDRSNRILQWKAEIDAERDLYQAAARSEPASLGGALNSVFTFAIGRARPLFREGEVLGIPQLDTAAHHAKTYEEAYVYMRGVFAKLLIDRAKERGEAATIGEVAQVLTVKKYPNIHKEAF